MKILVSGVAGDIGFGIGRILRKWGICDQLHGIDIHDDHPGRKVFDVCSSAPRASQPIYMDWLRKYLNDNCIDVFIPSSEAELEALACMNGKLNNNTKLLMNEASQIKCALDKHICLNYLGSHGIRVPDHGLVGDDTPSSYPVIVKPRRGQGSKGISQANDESELAACSRGYVWQELLLPNDEEYTCALYKSNKIDLRVIIFRRKLSGGLTVSGEVVYNKFIEEYIRSIAGIMDLCGVFNIQLRLTSNGPLLFEINPRLSSTLVFRDMLGFADLRWWLSDTIDLPVNKKLSEYIPPPNGTKFYRGSNEYIV